MPIVIDVDPVAVSVLGFHVRWYGIIVAESDLAGARWRTARDRRALA